MIPYGRQSISDDDVQAVLETLRSPLITQGPCIPAFERAVADYCGARHAVAVSSGTAALHLACIALDLGPGDIAWTTPITFVASANCALYCGASVDFVDIDPDTFTMDPQALAEKLESAARTGALPRVLVPVHLAGRPCDMTAIHGLAEKYGIKVLEDACHALGAVHRDVRVGACDNSDGAVFSFHPVKLITTGEGGVITTNDDAVARRLRRLREHGMTRDPAEMSSSDPDPWQYEVVELGYNYRLTDLQAALGISQLRRLEEFLQRRNELAARYRDRLSGLPLRLPAAVESGRSAHHLFVVLLDEEARRRCVFQALREVGIGTQVHYIPVHTQPMYRERGFRPGDFPVSEAHYRRALTIPLYHGMTDAEQDEVIAALRRILT